jgi:GT2 family glycosyltransferase
MTACMPVALIVVNYNGRHLLEQCLTSLLAQDYPAYSVLLVDNASQDGSPDYVQQRFPGIRVLRNKYNAGFGAGANSGLCATAAEIAVLLNPDIEVRPDWLRKLVGPLIADPQAGIAGCKMYYPGGRTIQHAGGYITCPQAFPGHYGLHEEDSGQYDTPRDVDYVIGAVLAVKRETLARIGLFDEGFFLFYEDVDLCTRAKQAGYRVIYVPDAVAVHAESTSTVKGSRSYYRHMHGSRWRYLLKHCEPAELLSETFPAEERWLATCRRTDRQAPIAAYRAALRALPEIWAQRTRAGAGGSLEASWQPYGQIASGLEQLCAAAWSLPEPYPGENANREAVDAPAMGTQKEGAGHVMQTDEAEEQQWHSQAVLREYRFHSDVPLLGPLIARFREGWNSISTKWYVRVLAQQQSEFNLLLLDRLQELQADMNGLEGRLIDQDREGTQLHRDLAELTVQVITLNRQLASLDTRLAELVGK